VVAKSSTPAPAAGVVAVCSDLSMSPALATRGGRGRTSLARRKVAGVGVDANQWGACVRWEVRRTAIGA